jgi:hypothetical protein
MEENFTKIRSLKILYDMSYPDIDFSINKCMQNNNININQIISITKESDTWYRVFFKE